MTKSLVLYAHPNEGASVATRRLARVADRLDHVEVRRLYDLYPDFFLARDDEQQALESAQHIFWLFPIYWYSCPSLMKEWIDIVLERGWAYGEGGTALQGKSLTLAVSTGTDKSAYGPQGMHGDQLDTFLRPFERTAALCGMDWQQPYWLDGAAHINSSDILNHEQAFERLLASGDIAGQGTL